MGYTPLKSSIPGKAGRTRSYKGPIDPRESTLALTCILAVLPGFMQFWLPSKLSLPPPAAQPLTLLDGTGALPRHRSGIEPPELISKAAVSRRRANPRSQRPASRWTNDCHRDGANEMIPQYESLSPIWGRRVATLQSQLPDILILRRVRGRPRSRVRRGRALVRCNKAQPPHVSQPGPPQLFGDRSQVCTHCAQAKVGELLETPAKERDTHCASLRSREIPFLGR
jgi:hypothetical protein